MRLLSMLFNYRPFFTLLAIALLFMDSVLFAASEQMDFEITLVGWFGLFIIEAVSVFSGFALFNRLFPSKYANKATLHKLEQNTLLEQLREAQDSYICQAILDKMMSEDLLRGIDLRNATLHEIHLESANLENANLCKASFREGDFEGTNLQRALLTEADVKNGDLTNANLYEAQLGHTHFDGATLAHANLSGANLQYACLRGASLYNAELEGAHLDSADLRGCCLMGANLSKATLNDAIFDTATVLPDGEQWAATTDVRRFTDDTHPQFVSYKTPNIFSFKECSPSTAE